MKMQARELSRRDFVKCTGFGLVAFSLTSCALPRQEAGRKQAFNFVQLCDPQLGMGGYEQDMARFKAAVKQINTMNPDFVVICGDLVHNPDEISFRDFLRIKEGFTVPVYCACGNHDVTNEPTLETLSYYRELVGEDYYSFEHKGCLFVVINTQLWKAPVAGETEQHDLWLKETLHSANRRGLPVLIIGHYPIFLKDLEEEDVYMNLPLQKRRQVLAQFESNGVVAVLGGHTHRLIINEYNGIQLVNGETISKNFDKRPFGFRVWSASETGGYHHEFVALEEDLIPL